MLRNGLPSDSEIKVLIYLCRRCASSDEGHCRTSTREIAEGTGLDEREVGRTILQLCPPGGERICVTPQMDFELRGTEPRLPTGIVRLWPEARQVLREEIERQKEGN